MATTADFRNGLVLMYNNDLHVITEFQHVKPGKGPAFVRTKLRNIKTGKVLDNTFNAGVKVETARVEQRPHQYLFKDDYGYTFMDNDTFDQVTIPAAVVGDAENFMLEASNATIAFNEGTPLYIELPPSVVLEITESAPGLQGDRSTGGTKPATVETGYEIQVPLFLETGTKVKVDTRTGDYLGRVND